MVTIHSLDVSFEVEGDGDEAVFARLFNKYIQRWNRQEAEMRERRRRVESERALNNRRSEEMD